MTFSGSAAKWVFWGGTLSSLALFLVLTADTQHQINALTHADRLDEKVVAGKRVFEKYNCNDCHTILGFGGYYAPDLTRVYGRLGEAGIRLAVEKPDQLFAKSFRKMPVSHMQPEELAHLVAFFGWVNEIDNNGWPPQDEKFRKSQAKGLVATATLSPGAALVQEKGCMTCHAIGGVGGNAGPALDHAGAKRTREALAALLADPQSVNPQALMPPAEATPAELDAIAEFLSRQK